MSFSQCGGDFHISIQKYNNTNQKCMVGMVEYYKNWGNILTLCYIIVNVFVNIVYCTSYHD